MGAFILGLIVGAGGALAQLLQCRELRLYLLDAVPDSLQESLTRGGRRNTARRAGQEPDTESCLESLERMTQRRARNPELGRGRREASIAGHRQEGQKIIEIFTRAIGELPSPVYANCPILSKVVPAATLFPVRQVLNTGLPRWN